jgi:hypothetical protein
VDLDKKTYFWNILQDHFLLKIIVALTRLVIAPRSISIGSLNGCESDPPLGGWLPAPNGIFHLEALSSEKASIDGPCARAEHRHAGG